MKRLLMGILSTVLLSSILEAQSSDKKPPARNLPALIDRELLFGNPEISGAQLSPNGKYLSFQKLWKGMYNIYVTGVVKPFATARLLTTEDKHPIPRYFWTRDSKYILYLKDNDGDENYNIYAIDPAARLAVGRNAPAERDLTGLKGIRVEIFELPKSDPDVVYIGLNNRDKAWHDLYKLKISTGEKTLIYKNTERIRNWSFDVQGNLRLAIRSAENGDTEILRVDADKLTKIYSCNAVEFCEPARFQKDQKRFYLRTNKGAGRDLVELALFDPATGNEEFVESDPLKRVDFAAPLFSEATDKLAITFYQDDRMRLYFKDKTFAADFQWLEKRLPGKEVARISQTRNEQLWLVLASSDTEPGHIYLLDRKTHTLMPLYKLREKLPRDALVGMKTVRYKSSDGLEIPAYLTLPKGVSGKNVPAIIFPHDGPWGRDVWGYNPYVQFFANRGYAVLSMNFRGSTGYGKKFIEAGNQEWGGKMQDDVTWGAKYLIAEGIADPKRVGIFGESYGGYATLAGLAFTQDVYAAGVDLFGPSNLITLLDSIPPYRESIRQMYYQRVGNPGKTEGRALLIERSPLMSAGKIRAPLMIVQGANDARVHHTESEQIVVALSDRGFPVKYLVIPDETHGFSRPLDTMASLTAIERFFANYLGGRYQEGGTPEMMSRLNEITIDPKTVVLAKQVNPNAVGLPTLAVGPQPATNKYTEKLWVEGQEIAIERTQSIKTNDDGGWVVSNQGVSRGFNSPPEEGIDTAVLEKGTLALRKRSVRQGLISIEVIFTGDKATGIANIGGRPRKIAVDLGGPVFADPSSPFSIACLPLAEGYTTTFRNFDLHQLKERVLQLKVVGSETVTVAAGTFDTFRVEINPVDGGNDHETLWITRDTRKAVKVAEVLGSMGGATLTGELIP